MSVGSNIALPKKISRKRLAYKFLSSRIREFELLYNLSPKIGIKQIKKLQDDFLKIIEIGDSVNK